VTGVTAANQSFCDSAVTAAGTHPLKLQDKAKGYYRLVDVAAAGSRI
jgi:hypothetical protein